VIVPLYPQYSGSTNGSSFDAVASALSNFRWVPRLHFVNSYYQHAAYIEAIAESIKDHWLTNGKAQKLLMSFHGVPQKYIRQGDPYETQCNATAQAVAEKLGLDKDNWMLVFQSRFGAQKWLEPYCDQTLMALPEQGIESVDIICPGFSVDCLETLEEIEGENREYFIAAGGKQYNYIPCLNAQPQHAKLMASIVSNIVHRETV
jgi:ferrochelatase